MTAYALHLLGTPRLEIDGTEIHINRRKAMALLAYLAVTGRPHTRDALATLLWPESDASGARGALRRHLSQVNQLLGGEGLETDRETVQLNPGLDLWLDVAFFRRCLAGCESHDHRPTRACATCLPHLEEGIALYRDRFMAGFTLEDSAAFDDWQVFCAESLKEEMAGALVGVATYVASLGDLERAVAHTRRWLALDPVSEPAHRHLMVLYAKSNRRTAALRQYETCCRALERELGAEPSKRTQEVYLQLLRDELPAAPAAAEAILERELRTVGLCPYRGLAPFRELDASLFFGRASYIERLQAAVTDAPFITAVVGPSGSGKSSVVAAGLLPRLRGAGGWLIATFRPGSQPFHSLANALVPALEPDLSETARLIERRHLADALAGGEIALIDVIARIRDQADGHPSVLLFIDQFEELYTLCPDGQMRHSFIDTVLAAVQTTPPARYEKVPLVLLFTLRADFMGQALTHRHLADALQRAAQMLGPMTREELHAAIAKPAEAQGAAFEAGLVERLLDDVAGEPGNLPLLEFALTLLWERLDFGWLTHAAYEQIGRAEGALARYAQEEFEALTSEDQQLARRIFVQLVQPGEGTEDTRRVAARADLATPPGVGNPAGLDTPGGLGDEAWGLVRHLADRRLVVTDHDPGTGVETVEVVHEALIQHWQQLQAWMAEDRAFRTWQERLRAGLRTWEATNRDEGALLRGVPLAEAEEWLHVRDLGQTERDFVQMSIALRERRTAERAAQQQRELEAARQLTEAHDQAVREREEALRQAAIGLAAEARTQMQGPGQDVAPVLALEAVEHYPYTWQAELALGQAVLEQYLVQQLQHGAALHSAELSPDSTRILTSGVDGMLRVWDLKTGENQLDVTAYAGHGGDHTTATWSPSGDRILTSAMEEVPRIWDATTGELLLELAGHGGIYADWSPDGTRILSYYSFQEDAATVWDAQTGDVLHTLAGNKGIVKLAFFSPDGRWIISSIGKVWEAETGRLHYTLPDYQGLITRDNQLYLSWAPDGRAFGAGMDGTARTWDVVTGDRKLMIQTGHRGRIKLWWSPNGDRLLTMGENQPARLWGVSTGRQLHQFPMSSILNVGIRPWSPTNDFILLPSGQVHARIWDADSGAEVLTLIGHDGFTHSSWLPSGEGFITMGSDGWARVWRTSTAKLDVGCRPNCPFADRGGFTGNPTWSPEGNQVARNYVDGTIRIWDMATGAELLRFKMDGTHISYGATRCVAWSPDSAQILTAGGSGHIQLRDSQTGLPMLELTGHTDQITAVCWSPSGLRILTTCRDGTAIVWEAATGDAITTYAEHTPYAAVWSPDGARVVTVDLHSHGGPVLIWDAATGETLLTLLPDDYAFGTSAVAWSPDGARIATFSDDQIGRIWDPNSGKQLATFAGVSSAVGAEWSPSGNRLSVGGASGIKVWDTTTLQEVIYYPTEARTYASWSPDGTAIAIAYYNGDLKVYPAWESLEELVAYAKEHCVLRDLTPEERAQFGLPER